MRRRVPAIPGHTGERGTRIPHRAHPEQRDHGAHRRREDDRLGAAVKRREDTHKMAEANKAFSHFKW
jgi:hypothetical protein